jgi:hypothetical protein
VLACNGQPPEIALGRKDNEVLSKLKKNVNFREKPPNSIAQDHELGGKYSDDTSEKKALSIGPDRCTMEIH